MKKIIAFIKFLLADILFFSCNATEKKEIHTDIQRY